MSTDANIEEQRTGTELKVPECLAATSMMKGYAIDLVRDLTSEKQQEILDYVQQCYEEGLSGERERMCNPAGFLKSLVSTDARQDDKFKVVVPPCLLNSCENNNQRLLGKISYLSVEEQQALLNYVDEKHKSALIIFNKENKMRWKKPSSLVAKNPEGFLMEIIKNGISEDEFKVI